LRGPKKPGAVILAAAAVWAASCGSSHGRVQELPVMRAPLKILEGGEMWEKWSFSFTVDGPVVHALTGDDEGLRLVSLRQDGADMKQAVLLEADEAWWDLGEDVLQEACGGEEVFEEGSRIVLGRKAVVPGKEGFLVAFGAASDLSCKSSRKEVFERSNYFLALFDEDWKLRSGPWKAREGENLLAFVPILHQGRPGLFWLTKKAVGHDLAPEGFEGRGESSSRPVDMGPETGWGRHAALAESGPWLVAAYAEEVLGTTDKTSVTVLAMDTSSGEMKINRLRSALTPTAVELRPTGEEGMMVLWALTGQAAPAGTITSVLKVDLREDGSSGPPETVFERKDMAGTAFLVKKLACACDARTLAVAWVCDTQGMDGMEERIGLFTSGIDAVEKGELWSYPIAFGQRGVKSICLAKSGSQYLIFWELRGLYQIRTAISTIH
jgi:hypothetical protein